MYTVGAIGPIPPEIENTRGARSHARFLSPTLLTPASSLGHSTYNTALGTYYDKMGHACDVVKYLYRT